MDKYSRYIIIGFSLAIISYLLWFFSNVVVYILLSYVMALIGAPLVYLIERIHIKNQHVPRWLAAITALISIWSVFALLIYITVPLIIYQANELTNANFHTLLLQIKPWIEKIENVISGLNPDLKNFSIESLILQELQNFADLKFIQRIFSSLAEFLGNAFIAFFSISFISFFFLKDEDMFGKSILLLFPEKHEGKIKNSLNSIKNLLSRYFIGIFIQSLCVASINSIGLIFIGLPIQTAIFIGIITGILNIIPYIGPLIGEIIGLGMAFITLTDLGMQDKMLIIILSMIGVFLFTKIIDNVIFQPLIYSNSIYAHPLEIFIVFLLAGSIAGALGMLIAIPSYIVLRVIAKEFFSQLKIVQKITQNL